MIVLSRDLSWRSRLKKLAEGGGWSYEEIDALPVPGRAPATQREIAVLDRGLAGRAPGGTVAALRRLYPGALVALACDTAEMNHAAAAASVTSGADDILAKSWSDANISARLAALRDLALSARALVSADGGLKAERRAHRAFVKSRGRWKAMELNAGAFALLWCLLESEGRPVSRERLGAALTKTAGRELEAGALSRRLAALRKALGPWKGEIVNERGGSYRLAARQSLRRSTT